MSLARLAIPLALALFASACAGARARHKAKAEAPYAGELRQWLVENPLGPGQKSRVTVLKRTQDATIQIIQTMAEVAPHKHRNSDETVYVLEGRGVLEIGDDKLPAAPGSFFFIPRGTRHAFTPEGTAAALSIFTPTLGSNDRVYDRRR